MKTQGVTLWQILAVLFIISAVTAMIFPLFAKAHEKGGPTCPSNPKQFGLGILQYAQDYDELMPNISDGTPQNTWRRAIYPYVKSEGIYLCPNRNDKNPGPDGFFRSYGANYSGNYSGSLGDQGFGAFAGPGAKGLTALDFKNPATVISLCEVAGSNAPEFNIDDGTRFGPSSHLLWSNHMGRGSYLFVDGHVKQLRPLETSGFWYRNPTRALSANGQAILKETQERAGR